MIQLKNSLADNSLSLSLSGSKTAVNSFDENSFQAEVTYTGEASFGPGVGGGGGGAQAQYGAGK